MLEEMLVYYARLPDREYGVELKNPSQQQVSEALFAVMEAAREIAFEYSPINWSGIKASCAKKALSLKQLAEEVAVISPAKLGEKLIAFVEKTQATRDLDEALLKKPKASVLEIVFSAYLGALFDATFPPEAIAWQKPSKEKREVRLIANYGGWQAVKKIGLEQSEKKEVVACCASVFERAKAKLPQMLLGQRTAQYESAVAGFLQRFPERKSFSRLGEILAAAASRASVVQAVAGSGEKLAERLQKLFYYACFERAGFTPFVNTDEVSRIWPELKISKPRGNLSGGKK